MQKPLLLTCILLTACAGTSTTAVQETQIPIDAGPVETLPTQTTVPSPTVEVLTGTTPTLAASETMIPTLTATATKEIIDMSFDLKDHPEIIQGADGNPEFDWKNPKNFYTPPNPDKPE
jgi:hypothetical protein